jgi:hypothetical protein
LGFGIWVFQGLFEEKVSLMVDDGDFVLDGVRQREDADIVEIVTKHKESHLTACRGGVCPAVDSAGTAGESAFGGVEIGLFDRILLLIRVSREEGRRLTRGICHAYDLPHPAKQSSHRINLAKPEDTILG